MLFSTFSTRKSTIISHIHSKFISFFFLFFFFSFYKMDRFLQLSFDPFHALDSFVSAIHLLVGVVYCLISWSIGLPKRAVTSRIFTKHLLSYYILEKGSNFLVWFKIMVSKTQPMNKELLGLLTPVAACHALGHVMSNVSFAAVAVSFTHTIKGSKDL